MTGIQAPKNRTQKIAQALAPWVATALLVLAIYTPTLFL